MMLRLGMGVVALMLGAQAAWAEEAPHARPSLVIYWRSDCAPCLQELKSVPHIARTNPNVSIVLVALHNDMKPEQWQPYMASNVLMKTADDTDKNQMRADGDPSMALPFSVALHADGSLCEHHFGLLGTARAKEWAATC
jgi:thiol-disulfide isomerase/thioredoxin